MARVIKVPGEADFRTILDIYERGRVLDALSQSEHLAPLDEWGGVEGCVLAARIAANVGAQRLKSRLVIRAWRTDQSHPAAQLQYGFEVSERRGPLALWRAMRQWPEPRDGPALEQAELLALKSTVAGDLRDFATAENLLKRAEALEPRKPWVRLQRAHLLERQDRVEEALEIANEASTFHPHPFYRPGVQASARLLQLLDRDEDAIQLLRSAETHLQSGAVAVQLFALLSENGCWAEAHSALERFVALSPLLEPPGRRWVAGQRARVSYHLGKRAEAARLAAALDDPFHAAFSKRLNQAPEEPERVQLDVSFVRQHFKTCAPATLAALGRYWSMSAEHLKVAEAICYDGTPAWQQRTWAEQNGWFVREFRVTQESAMALVARGIPFAITTVEATSAHMQAVVGFDRARQTLLLRDPDQPYIVEFAAEIFLTRYRPFGPRGMILLPAKERARTEGVTLPDAEAYDDYHQLWIAIGKHDRPGAAAVLGRMETTFPDHALTWEARLDLATYDGNDTEQARCLDKLIEMFPGNPARTLRQFSCMRDTPRDGRIRFLEQICAAKGSDPAMFVELARVLENDARCLPQARQWLRRALRLRPMDSNAIGVLADLCWLEGSREEATDLYRIAANLEGFKEHLYQVWFRACRSTRRTDEAMDHLQDRFLRFGRRSEQPALTLAWAWREMEAPGRALKVLTEAARLRPDDGQLVLRAASLVARLGESNESERLLDAAKGRVRETDWLRTAAEIAENHLDTESAMRWSRELLGREPLALDAHGCVARSLARLEGHAAALAYLRNAAAQYPNHYGLKRMLVEWSRDSGPLAVEAAAREMLRADPADAWALRELATALSKSDRTEEALRVATEAVRIEPWNSFSFSIVGFIHQQLQNVAEAKTQLRRAVELCVDNGGAIGALIGLAHTDSGRKEELALVERQLIRQVVAGDGLLAFLDMARPVLEPEKLLTGLRQAHMERPDLWHAWAALVSQLGHLNRLDEALQIATQATERFPHLPRTWLDLASVHRWREDPDAEIAAAQRAFEINPSWSLSTMKLAGALERCGRLDEALRVHERALQHSPFDAPLHASRAHLLWQQRQNRPALEAVERALRLDPDFDWAWSLLDSWAKACGDEQRAGMLARALTRERPGEARVWLILARVLADPSTLTERLAATEKALELEPRSTDGWDLKAELLVVAERFDDAIKACSEGEAICPHESYTLRGRHAWIESRRRQSDEAIRIMRSVLVENSSYVWGWNQLAHWLIERGSFEDATSALEQLLRLRPHDAWVNRQLGFLKLKQGDHAGAQQAFVKTIQLAPTDAFAARNLFDLQLQTGDLDGAAATLHGMRTHQPGAGTLASEIELHLRRNERPAAMEGLKALCTSSDPDSWPLEAAVDAFKRAGLSSKSLKILKQALKDSSCNPEVGNAAIRLLLARRKDVAAVRLFERLKPGEIQRRAAAPLVQGLAELKSSITLRWLLWRRRTVLAGDDAAWGQVGFALSRFGRMREVARWLADWRTRTNVQPWMLFNYCLALRHQGRYEESTQVARHVLATWGHREGSADMRLFLAVEEALAGSIPAAQEHLRRVVIRENVQHDQQLLALAQALVEFQEAPLVDRSKRFKTIRDQLGARFSSWGMLNLMKDVRRTFRRAGKMVARGGGGWSGRLWFGWKLNWQWLLLPLAPLLLAVAAQPPVLIGLLLWRWSRRRQS